jgi:hypothetical protein
MACRRSIENCVGLIGIDTNAFAGLTADTMYAIWRCAPPRPRLLLPSGLRCCFKRNAAKNFVWARSSLKGSTSAAITDGAFWGLSKMSNPLYVHQSRAPARSTAQWHASSLSRGSTHQPRPIHFNVSFAGPLTSAQPRPRVRPRRAPGGCHETRARPSAWLMREDTMEPRGPLYGRWICCQRPRTVLIPMRAARPECQTPPRTAADTHPYLPASNQETAHPMHLIWPAPIRMKGRQSCAFIGTTATPPTWPHALYLYYMARQPCDAIRCLHAASTSCHVPRGPRAE